MKKRHSLLWERGRKALLEEGGRAILGENQCFARLLPNSFELCFTEEGEGEKSLRRGGGLLSAGGC